MDWQEVLCLSSGCTGGPRALSCAAAGKAGFSIPAALVMLRGVVPLESSTATIPVVNIFPLTGKRNCWVYLNFLSRDTLIDSYPASSLVSRLPAMLFLGGGMAGMAGLFVLQHYYMSLVSPRPCT
jgi:hypothetical protein